ncbi:MULTISPECIES: SRPBCC domain-containing protein [unclassified Streptomyces]|uniref:SRPBCC domain-containing protein n=1 Tax=unclassified Streptomyces TaxID=2593676 RepID=UPI003829450F
MEHEVFVPVEAQSLRQTLRDPARVAGCVPGLQQDAGEPPIAGRLKVRLGGSTITYRGALRVSERDGEVFAFEGEGVEVRGAGAAELALTVRLEPAPGGTLLAFAGTALAEGRAADVPAEAVRASAARLLDRFASALARPAPAELADTDLNTDLDAAELASVFDTEVPPPSLDRLADEEFAIEVDETMPAEAAHARRTMIGRSAEEVDHAPPRGRYAPVPAPTGAGAGVTLRWVAPAAALALASAVVVGRALRRRR